MLSSKLGTRERIHACRVKLIIQNHLVCGLRPSSEILNKRTTFRKLNQFPSSGERNEAPTLLGPLDSSNLNHLPSLEDGNRSSSENVKFSGYLEFLTMSKVYNANDFDCYTSSSEPFKFYKLLSCYHADPRLELRSCHNRTESIKFSITQ
jgi:hypothetical protein